MRNEFVVPDFEKCPAFSPREPICSTQIRLNSLWFEIWPTLRTVAIGCFKGAKQDGNVGIHGVATSSKRALVFLFRCPKIRAEHCDRINSRMDEKIRQLKSTMFYGRRYPRRQRSYDWRPVLIETFVDESRFRASCYRAANWQYRGTTQMRRSKNQKSRRRAQTVQAAETENQSAADRCGRSFRLVFSHNEQGYAAVLVEFWRQCRQLGIAMPNAQPCCSGASCSSARRRATRSGGAATHSSAPSRRALPAADPAPGQIRVGRQTVALATTLMDRRQFPTASLSHVHHSRWGIEEQFETSEQMMMIEKFHAHSERGVKQESYAHFALIIRSCFFDRQSLRTAGRFQAPAATEQSRQCLGLVS